MKYLSGLILSEMVTALLAAMVFVAIGFGLYVSNQRDRMVESAKASITAVVKHAAAANESDQPIVCDNSLVDPSLLANKFLSLSVKPTRVVNNQPSKGYGVGIHVHSNQKTDSDDTFVTAVRLFDVIKEEDEDILRLTKKEDDEIEYSILLSKKASCIKAEQSTIS